MVATLNCAANVSSIINFRGRLLALVVVMVGWLLSWLWQRWSWRIETAKSGVHGAGVFLLRVEAGDLFSFVFVQSRAAN